MQAQKKAQYSAYPRQFVHRHQRGVALEQDHFISKYLKKILGKINYNSQIFAIL